MIASEAALYLNKAGVINPEVAVILGTGLGGTFADDLKEAVSVNYNNIPHFPASTVQSHTGKLVFGTLHKRRVMIMQGRAHYYEGYSVEKVTYPIRVMKALGVKILLLTNAAGNLNLEWKKGEIMLIRDHINLQPVNPLRGVKIEPDNIYYSAKLSGQAKNIAERLKIKLREGVYASVSGPSLETRSEYRFFRTIGVDAVGMSTVPEVLMAKQSAMEVCALSVLTNDCDPENLQTVELSDMIGSAALSADALHILLAEIIKNL